MTSGSRLEMVGLPRSVRVFHDVRACFYIHDGIYMNSGCRLEMVGSPRSVGGFHSVWACSGVF
jgi:hypothetical protein